MSLLLLFAAGNAGADELILDQSSIAVKRGGDFTLSVSSDAFFQRDVLYLANLDDKNVEVSAGQLWTHFKSHGIDSLDRLILFMDVDPDMLANGPIELENLQIIIEDPQRPGRALTQASLDRDDPTNRIVWKSTTGRNTVARVELELGYDFMSRFSSGSEQKLVLHLTTADGSIPITKVGIAGEREIPMTSKALMLVLFVVFWAGVFAIMYRITKPTTTGPTAETPILANPTPVASAPTQATIPEDSIIDDLPIGEDESAPSGTLNGKRNGKSAGSVTPQLPPTRPECHHDVTSDVDASHSG